jgi:preprotein translocase SecE subunit
MAKSRAQRKAERRKREARQAAQAGQERQEESRAQHDTQVPETADVIEAELAEHGVDLDELKHAPDEPAPEPPPEADPDLEAPAPSRADVGAPAEAEGSDKISRRARKAEEREQKRKAKESQKRRAPKDAPVERQRGGVTGFIASCWAELKRVQWPDRETLIQASAITLIFIAVMAAYLGVLDAIFNWLVQRIL